MTNRNLLIKRSIFFAFPWNPIIKKTYEKIFKENKSKWERNFNLYYGSESITMPAKQGEIEKFRTQNKQLFDIFVENIQRSDLFMADITDVNPNVMVELGIAIKLNKNILILSGSPYAKLPFDISGIKIEFYNSADELQNKINTYLNLFLEIKNIEFEKKIPNIYFGPMVGVIKAGEEFIQKGGQGRGAYVIERLPINLPKMKDLKLRTKYKIVRSFSGMDWFGIMLRSATNDSIFGPLQGSILVNTRANGNTDITLYPEEKIARAGKTHRMNNGSFRSLNIILDNKYIKVTGDEGDFQFDSLNLINFGEIYIACFCCEVQYKDLEILNIDTTSEIIS